MTLERDFVAEPHRVCPYCKRHHTEIVTDTFVGGWGGVDQPGARYRRCTDPTCQGRQGWPLDKEPEL